MKNTDAVLFICIVVLTICCAGEPDLIDAVISYINRQ
jgi:hypothetical protein